MYMTKSRLCILILFCAGSLFAQTAAVYSSVRISLKDKQMADLVATGIETDHGLYYPGKSLTTVLSRDEQVVVKAAGFDLEVLVPDLYQHYLDQRAQPRQLTEERGANCNESPALLPDYKTPDNYTYGTMGGYLTYSQMMAELDKMRALFPNLITDKRFASDTLRTWQGRPIYHVKISDNPDDDEPEREVLYTALHHAREPNSASQMIFFMWYLLENYATRDDVRALVDNLEMYFVPCINVDGYLYNESIAPTGGGLWRKNRRNNGDGTFGVDLNRNYGFFWGDFGGSSPDPVSEIYRGPEAFSEPETRIMRDFCREHDFLMVLNYHTSGNLLIYPWAYSDEVADSAFITYGAYLTRENNFRYGTTTETVGYNVNGSSDDWMYAEKGSYCFTPEVGKTGFWPMPEEIDALNKSNLWQNFALAFAALKYGEATDKSDITISGLAGTLPVDFRRYGLEAGAIEVQLVPYSSNILSGAATTVFDIAHLATAHHDFSYTLDAAISDSASVVFLLKVNNGLWVKTDTLRKIYKAFPNAMSTVFQDDLSNTAFWQGDWALTSETFHSAPTCMTDSPNSAYLPEQYPVCTSVFNTILPPNILSANLRFFAKWDIEDNWDYVQVSAIGSNGSSAPLCGLFTNTGENVQAEGPVFDGTQSTWVEECMDITEYAGQTLYFSFNFGSDGGIEADGFYFDDVRVEYVLPTSGVQTIALSALFLAQNEPNPASDFTRISWSGDDAYLKGDAQITVVNAQGVQVLRQQVSLDGSKSVLLDVRQLPAGVYTCHLQQEQAHAPAIKMTVVR
jgi:hypothetical protein